jgi:hypothetical protein
MALKMGATLSLKCRYIRRHMPLEDETRILPRLVQSVWGWLRVGVPVPVREEFEDRLRSPRILLPKWYLRLISRE